ncbi:MAG TPA: PspC domain-containing protein [Candidatus Binatia bacterium]|nr:PspC domain-containing protein [Candidatus Binatia bacterium]
MDAVRRCPYCAEEILVEAVRCRHCRSWLTARDPQRWHRDHPERRLAGVAAALAHALALPVAAVRLAFLALTFVHFLGPLLYLALWLVVPLQPGGEPPLGRLLGLVRTILADLGLIGRPTPPAGPVPGGPTS